MPDPKPDKKIRKKSLRADLNAKLKAALGHTATVELLKVVNPKLLEQLRAGVQMPRVADLLVDKIIKLALDPAKANQWAVELVWDRSEGRAVAGQAPENDGRKIEDRLNVISKEHLNAIATQFSTEKWQKAEEENRNQATADPAPGLPPGLLDLPSHGAGSTQALGGQSSMATEAKGAG